LHFLKDILLGGKQLNPAFLDDAPHPIFPASTKTTSKLWFSIKLIAQRSPVYPPPITTTSELVSFLSLSISKFSLDVSSQ
jgi:hypothetical protein